MIRLVLSGSWCAFIGPLVMFSTAASYNVPAVDREAEIYSVKMSGNLAGVGLVDVYLDTEVLQPVEIGARLKKFPLYGANPLATNPRQRAMKALEITILGKTFSAPESALQDLFDPGLVYTLRVGMAADKLVVSWAGGSGEKEYHCRFYATSERFIRREIIQYDNQNREVVTTKDL